MKSDRHNELLPRDAALARLLEEALESKAAGEAQGSACPDAEILAAYAEHGLSDREASRWDGHIADCSRCQKIIASVVLSGESLEEARNEEQGSSVPAFVIRKPGPGASGISRWPGFWRWWVPGLGLATAVMLWFVLHPALQHQASPQRAAATTTGTSQGGARGKSGCVFHKAGRDTDGSSEGAATSCRDIRGGRHIRRHDSRFGRAASKSKRRRVEEVRQARIVTK